MSASPLHLKSGLVSISFRKLAPEKIVELAFINALETIEWGGDVHVPHGDVSAARNVRKWCDDAGVGVSAYGSYYRAAASSGQSPAFEAVLDSAVALGALSIRVWAGNIGSADADAAARQRVADDLRRICSMAAAQGIRVALEYHGGTLTDSPGSAIALLKVVAHPNLRSYWQPRHGLPIEAGVSDIAALSPYLENVHVFHWWPDSGTRLPLADGLDRWTIYLAKLASLGGDHVLSLEFIRNEDLDQLAVDAKTLIFLRNMGLRPNEVPQ